MTVQSIPIIRSKLIMPQPPPVIMAPERLRRLAAGMQGKSAVFVTAPAGCGKTTLIAAALEKHETESGRVCWYRLDEEDAGLAVFYAHLVETLFPDPEQGGDRAKAGLAGCGDVFANHQYVNAVICQELWAWQTGHPGVRTFIVFDDFQCVLDTPEIAGAVQFFLDNLPDQCSIVISSRRETGLLTGKRVLSTDILQISRNDLCFSEEEVAAFVKTAAGIIPERDLLHRIMLRTEGWAAGIILACRMLGPDGPDQPGFFLDRPEARETFFQYLAAEVLKTANDRLVRFLAKAAVLPEFTCAAAGAVFEEDHASELVRQCEEKGLFIERIPAPGGETTYRFHALFREFLQEIQPRHLSPEEVRNCHLRAAAYYMEHRNFARASTHFSLCGGVDQAVELVIRESPRLITFGDVDQLRLWFALLPEEAVSASAHLLYIKSRVDCQEDIDGALRLLERAQALFRQAADGAMQVRALTQMAHLYILRSDMPGIRKIHAWVRELSGRVQEPSLAGNIAVFDFALTIMEGRLSKAAALSRRVTSLPLADEWQWVMLFYSAVMYSLLGDIDQAQGLFQQALSLEMPASAALQKGYTRIWEATVLQLKDDRNASSDVLDEVSAIREKRDYQIMLGFGKRLAALAGYRRHDLEGALEQLDASTRCFEQFGNAAMAASNHLYRCLWLCAREDWSGSPAGDVPRLLAGAGKALKVLTASSPAVLYPRETGMSVFGAIARECGDYPLAEKTLLAAVRGSKAKGTRQILAGALLHLAKLRYDTGDQAAGEECLRQGFDLIVANKYVMFWDLHFPTLVEMAARCVKSRIHAAYAPALIARYYGPDAAGFLARTAVLTADNRFRNFTRAFMARYGRARSEASGEPAAARISVNLFGRFEIAVSGIGIPDQAWKTRKIAGILKFLLAHRGRPVSRDQLLEVFWPEVDVKTASVSLRAALHELRKVLRKFGAVLDGRESFLNEERGRLEVRTSHLLAVDVDSFLAQGEELKKVPANMEGRARRKTILSRMVALYRGDFLEGETHEDWFFAEREELRSLYLLSVIELADLHVADGEHAQAEKLLLKVLATDQYNEEACLRLLQLYVVTNQRGRAVRFHSDFVSRFERELGIKPDEKLTLVFKALN